FGWTAAVTSDEDDTEHLHGFLAALHVARTDRHTGDRRRGGDRRCGRDDLAALGLGLQPLRDVHGVAHDRVLQASTPADRPGDHRPGVDADPYVELVDV